MKILLIGPQGSGKSTQGRLLADYLKVPYISTGDIFRDIASLQTDEGKRIKQILEAGQLVDDQTATAIIKQRLNLEDCQNGFILDGYPRTVVQANSLDIDFDKVFYLVVPKEIVIERLLKRGRVDDKKESIEKRLELYYLQTETLREYFKDKGVLVEVNATDSIQTIQDEIKKSL